MNVCMIEFAKYIVSAGLCNHVNAVLDDYSDGDFYIYKSEWRIWQAAWKTSKALSE